MYSDNERPSWETETLGTFDMEITLSKDEKELLVDLLLDRQFALASWSATTHARDDNTLRAHANVRLLRRILECA